MGFSGETNRNGMLHGYRYNGAFERNFAALRPGSSTYVSTRGAECVLVPWPPDVDGIRVGYMERRGKKFFAVRVQFEDYDLVLENPVALDLARHLGNKRLSPRPVAVGDDMASCLLDDIIAANPRQDYDLARLINRVNQVRGGW
jgi:hypothetical protein